MNEILIYEKEEWLWNLKSFFWCVCISKPILDTFIWYLHSTYFYSWVSLSIKITQIRCIDVMVWPMARFPFIFFSVNKYEKFEKRSMTSLTNRFSITYASFFICSLQLAALTLTASVFALKSFHVHLLLDIWFEIVIGSWPRGFWWNARTVWNK